MPSIFVCYRRDDTAPYAGRLHDRLVPAFGRENIFMDINALAPGVDFDEEIRRRLARIDAILVLIGRQWMDSRDEAGDRRIDNPDDFVRLEIATALKSGIRVIPVLVGTARLPKSNALPEDIRGLARRQAIELSDTRWEYDTGQLIDSLGGARVTSVPKDPLAAPVIEERPLIYLGHSPRNDREALALYESLKVAGFSLWMDKHDLNFGEPLGAQVAKALSRARLVLLCFSKHNERVNPSDYDLALEIGESPVAVRFEACQIPPRFSRLDVVNVFAPSEPRQLIQTIRARLLA